MTNRAKPTVAWTAPGTTAIGVVAATAIVVAIIGPRAMLAVLAVFALLPLMSIGKVDGGLNNWRPQPLLIAVLIFAMFSMISAIWSSAPATASFKAAIIILTTALSYVSVASIAHLTPQRTSKLATAVVAGFAIGLAFIVIEELSNDVIKRTVFNTLGIVNRDPKHMVLKGEEIVNLAAYLGNRSVAVLTLLLWPVLGLLAALLPGTLQRPWLTLSLLLFAGGSLTAVVLSEHETSQIALLLGAILFVLTLLSRRAAFALATGAILLAVSLPIPMANVAYSSLELHKNQSLPYSLRARIVLWYYTAQQISKAPFLGVGAVSTERLDLARGFVPTLPDHPIPLRTARHAHNVYLEVWYELGAAGAALLLILGGAVVLAISRLGTPTQPFALAAFASGATIAASSWSLWQEWFIASMAMSAVICWLLHRLHAQKADIIGQDGLSRATAGRSKSRNKTAALQ